MRLNIDQVKKVYGGRTVLDIEALAIEEGKITGITGPNGCGKSTLLNIVSGYDGDFQGKIRYNGRPLDRKIRDWMTHVFQKPYLFKRTVYENIDYPLKIRNISGEERKKRILDILKRLEIEDLSEKRADLLSGGESQKVALARALVFGPKLLLLDEPTSNIDPESIKILEREILNFNQETAATIVIVTHNLEQSKRLCHNILYLEEGKVVKQ